MTATRRRLFRIIALTAALAAVALATGLTVTALRAQDSDPPAEPTEEQLAQWELWKQQNPDPFEPAPADPGAVQYADMKPEEQADVDEAALRAETKHGYAVHQSWSTYSHQAAARARIKEAEYAAGLAGIDDVGVE